MHRLTTSSQESFVQHAFNTDWRCQPNTHFADVEAVQACGGQGAIFRGRLGTVRRGVC